MSDRIFDVVMPQMGESITQATIIKWCKVPGEAVAAGETLLEISTDKVSAELPAAIAGTLVEVLYPVNTTVDVDTIIARIAPVGVTAELKSAAKADVKAAPGAPAAATATATAAGAPQRTSGAAPSFVVPPLGGHAPSPAAPSRSPQPTPARGARPTAAILGLAGRRGANGAGNGAAAAGVEAARADLLRLRSTPLVRNIANDLGVDLARIAGSGLHGRVTKKDIVAYVEGGGATGGSPTSASTPTSAPTARHSVPPPPTPRIAFAPGADEALEPLSPMRRLIADHMVASVRTSPHAYTVHEIDLTRLEKLRDRTRKRFEAEHDTRLTPLAFISLAVVEALVRFPTLNASLRGNDVVYHRGVNLGIAVALDNGQGLIVPVVRGADGMNLPGIARAIGDIATRARTKKLSPDDVKDGTFTLTSPGQLGALMGTPIINQPQAAILHIGAIAKRPAVVEGPDGEDLLTVRTRCMMTLGIDHRLIDGWIADSFMAAIRERLERADFPDLKA